MQRARWRRRLTTSEISLYTDFEDTLVHQLSDVDPPIYETGFSPWQHRKKVVATIRANEDHIAIAKLTATSR